MVLRYSLCFDRRVVAVVYAHPPTHRPLRGSRRVFVASERLRHGLVREAGGEEAVRQVRFGGLVVFSRLYCLSGVLDGERFFGDRNENKQQRTCWCT